MYILFQMLLIGTCGGISWLCIYTIQQKQRIRVLKKDLEDFKHHAQKLQALLMQSRQLKPSKKLGHVVVLVDGANLFKSANEANKKIDYECFLARISERATKVVTVNFYDTYDIESHRKLHWLEELKKLGFSVIAERNAKEGEKQPNPDMWIATDMARFARLCDTIILASGDGDFCYTVRELKKTGVSVEVWTFEGNLSRKLRQVANKFVDIGDPEINICRYLSSPNQQENTDTNNKNGSARPKPIKKHDREIPPPPGE